MTKITIEYESDDFFSIMMEKLDSILSTCSIEHIDTKVTIDFTRPKEVLAE